MSPRAACRLEGLGFPRVYDYVAGIADWKAAGLPTEGNAETAQLVADAARGDIPTCRPDDLARVVVEHLAAGDWETCVVTECDGVVVGRLRSDTPFRGNDLVSEVMEPGPSSVRPDQVLEPLVDRMERRQVPSVLVTTPQGTLMGVLLLEEAKRLMAGEPPERIWRDCEGCPGRWAHTQQARLQ